VDKKRRELCRRSRVSVLAVEGDLTKSLCRGRRRAKPRRSALTGDLTINRNGEGEKKERCTPQ